MRLIGDTTANPYQMHPIRNISSRWVHIASAIIYCSSGLLFGSKGFAIFASSKFYIRLVYMWILCFIVVCYPMWTLLKKKYLKIDTWKTRAKCLLWKSIHVALWGKVDTKLDNKPPKVYAQLFALMFGLSFINQKSKNIICSNNCFLDTLVLYTVYFFHLFIR